jgi:hypothetical protein
MVRTGHAYTAEIQCLLDTGGNDLTESHRSLTWRQLLNQHKREFLAWLEEKEVRLKTFNKLAEELEHFIIRCLTTGLTTDSFYAQDPSTAYLCEQFATCIPGVFTNCDDPRMYKQDTAALAYAHVYLLERYRRFWDVLMCLLDAAVLPMSDKGLEVLDVGTGPAPALFAVSDLYQALQDFASEKGYASLVTPFPHLNTVESSSNMVRFTHHFSEISERAHGVYTATFKRFDGLDFAELRANERQAWRWENDNYDYETGTRETLWPNAAWYDVGWTEGLFRYNLVIFSNFLTQKDTVENWRKELLSTFWSIRHGGIAVIVGGSGEKYQPVYDIVNEVAEKAALRRVTSVSEKVPCYYSDPYAKRIKTHYNTIWTWIRENSAIDEAFLTSRKIARKLWNPQKGLKESSSPSEFNLLVFRRSGRPWNLTRRLTPN